MNTTILREVLRNMGQGHSTQYDNYRHLINLNYLTVSITGQKAEIRDVDGADIFEFQFMFRHCSIVS